MTDRDDKYVCSHCGRVSYQGAADWLMGVNDRGETAAILCQDATMPRGWPLQWWNLGEREAFGE